jgi:putative flavoprotein involved in K+ transport
MSVGIETITRVVDQWLAQFERALSERDGFLLKALFHPDSYWRDVLALTWHIKTFTGLDTILEELKAHVGRAQPIGF